MRREYKLFSEFSLWTALKLYIKMYTVLFEWGETTNLQLYDAVWKSKRGSDFTSNNKREKNKDNGKPLERPVF